MRIRQGYQCRQNHRYFLYAQQRAASIAVLAQYPQITRALLYGSRAKGNYRQGSDVDLTSIGDIDLTTLNKINVALDDLLLPFEFDLSVFARIENEKLRQHIERVGIDFYTAPDVALYAAT